LAYCLHVTLARRLHALAPGLTARSVLEKFAFGGWLQQTQLLRRPKMLESAKLG